MSRRIAIEGGGAGGRSVGDDEPSSKRKGALSLSLLWRLYEGTKPYKHLRNTLFLLVIIRSAQLPVIGWLTAWVVTGPIAEHDLTGLGVGVLGLLAWTLATGVCLSYRLQLSQQLGEAVVQDLRRQVYARLLSLPVAYFKRTEGGRLVGRLIHDVNAVRGGMQDVFWVAMVQCGTILVSCVLMAYYDRVLFFVVLAMAPGLWLAMGYFRKALSVLYRGRSESLARMTTALSESINGIREIQASGIEQENSLSFDRQIQEHARAEMASHRIAAILPSVLGFNGQLFLAILLVLGGQRVLGGTAELAVVIQFVFLSTSFFDTIPVLGEQYSQALKVMAGAERVFRIVDTRPDWEDPADAQSIGRIEGNVEIRGLWFEYEPQQPVLRDINLVAKAGQTVALVGHTGSGKSTLTSLIAKFYLPTRGSVLVDRQDLSQVSSHSLHRQLACVTQHNVLFSGSVLDNLRLGCPEASREDAWAALDALGVADIVKELPGGLDCRVGERGVGLSLGQQQIVCFARAMLANPRMLILDEATSSVDSVTEARIQVALRRLLAGRTSFVVAHRLSTIVHADIVLVLDHGQIIERGSHFELLQRRGTYAKLYRAFVRTPASVVRAIESESA